MIRYLVLVTIISMHGVSIAEYKVRDLVVVIKRNAELNDDGKVVGTADIGTVLRVNAINGDWIWVRRQSPGWMLSESVVPFTEAIPRLNEMIVQQPDDAVLLRARAIVKSYTSNHTALEDINHAIRLNPNNSKFLVARAVILIKLGDLRNAIDDCDKAIQLDPQNAYAFYDRGSCRKRLNELDKAILDLNSALVINAKYASAYALRAQVFEQQKDYGKASDDLNIAIKLDPTDADFLSTFASFLAVCPEAKYRNGEKAFDLATKAGELSQWKYYPPVHALAAAYAECSDFANAIKYEVQAIELAPESWKAKYRTHLELFRDGKPARMAAAIVTNPMPSQEVPQPPQPQFRPEPPRPLPPQPQTNSPPPPAPQPPRQGVSQLEVVSVDKQFQYRTDGLEVTKRQAYKPMAVVWSYNISTNGDKEIRTLELTGAGDYLILLSDQHVYCFQSNTGKMVWKADISNGKSLSLANFGTEVVITTFDGKTFRREVQPGGPR